MAQVLRMPSEWELPEGPRRQLVEELFSYYRSAGRPTLRSIAEDIADNPEFDAFTASRETIRKLLRGKTVPPNWAVVNAVFWVLCKRAAIGPDLPRWTAGFGESSITRRENLRNLWNEALDAPPPAPVASSGWGSGATHGWGSGATDSFDKPPF